MSKVQNEEISAVITGLSGTLKGCATLGDAGVISFSKDAFEKTLPEGLTMDIFKRVGEHLTDVTAAMNLAVGELSVEAKVPTATAALPIVKSMGLSASYKQEYMVPNGNMSNPGMVKAYGGVQMALKFTGGKSRGQMKFVKRHITALATEAFGS